MTDEKLEKAVDEVFQRIRDIAFYTANTAKEIILQANKLGITTTEYLGVVSSYVKDFEKLKEGTDNENQ